MIDCFGRDAAGSLRSVQVQLVCLQRARDFNKVKYVDKTRVDHGALSLLFPLLLCSIQQIVDSHQSCCPCFLYIMAANNDLSPLSVTQPYVKLDYNTKSSTGDVVHLFLNIPWK